MYGPDKVGLLTGDTSINSEADIVVMTTEVLRNMLYERSTTLNALRYVILDEVHYLADRFRGPCGRKSSSTCQDGQDRRPVRYRVQRGGFLQLDCSVRGDTNW